MTIRIDEETCEKSGVCAAVCPEDVLEFVGKPVIVDGPGCTNCWICVEHCASGAIEID
jgi:NAD-dependent dihydropyrimidine dehydrogenase PreA subunit